MGPTPFVSRGGSQSLTVPGVCRRIVRIPADADQHSWVIAITIPA